MTNKFENSCLVVAHPDDEILFFGSIFDKVSKIIICYVGGESEKSFDSCIQFSYKYPYLKNIEFLLINQSFCYGDVDWKRCQITNYGIQLSSGFANIKYFQNYQILKDILNRKLHAFKSVFTHNPWGEAEHAEHLQIFQIVSQLQKKFNFDLYYTNYIHILQDPQMEFARNVIKNRKIVSPKIIDDVNVDLCLKIKKEYETAGIWTGHPNFDWKDRTFDEIYLDRNDPECTQIMSFR